MDKQDLEIALTDASSKYVDSYKLRALVSVVPMIGGALDQLFSGAGAKWQAERVGQCLNELNVRLEGVEGVVQKFTEDFYDLSTSAFEGVVKTKSEEKIKRFANILANKALEEDSDWDDAQLAVSILTSLEVVHLDILLVALSNRHVSIGGSHGTNNIFDLMAGYDYKNEVIRVALFDLISKGFFSQSGSDLGTLNGGGSIDTFEVTDSARWFSTWITSQDSLKN